MWLVGDGQFKDVWTVTEIQAGLMHGFLDLAHMFHNFYYLYYLFFIIIYHQYHWFIDFIVSTLPHRWHGFGRWALWHGWIREISDFGGMNRRDLWFWDFAWTPCEVCGSSYLQASSMDVWTVTEIQAGLMHGFLDLAHMFHNFDYLYYLFFIIIYHRYYWFIVSTLPHRWHGFGRWALWHGWIREISDFDGMNRRDLWFWDFAWTPCEVCGSSYLQASSMDVWTVTELQAGLMHGFLDLAHMFHNVLLFILFIFHNYLSSISLIHWFHCVHIAT